MIVALLALWGCDADGWIAPVELHTSTRGVALVDDGDSAVVGMRGKVCTVDVRRATIRTDYDFPGDAEAVQQVALFGSAVAALVIADDRVVAEDLVGLSARPPGWAADAPGARAARFAGDGLAILVDGEAGSTLTFTEPPRAVELPHATALAADASTGAAWVSTVDGVLAVDGAWTRADADLVAWDAVDRAVYVARAGEDRVDALTADGEPLWSEVVPGAVRDLEAAGGAAGVLVDGDDGPAVHLVDAAGARLVTTDAPGATELSFSSNGASFAVVYADRVHFRRLP